MNKRTNLIVATVVAGVATLSVPAAAYVRTTTSTGVPTAWKAPCITMEFSLGAPPPKLDGAAYLAAAQQAGETWTQASLDGVNRCSNVRFSVDSVDDTGGQVGKDGHNRMIFRQASWCRDPPPTDPNEPPCYAPQALAITSVFQWRTTGEILDADMEINAHDFTWGDFAADPIVFDPNTHDFLGTVTHEMGHVIGLDHTCFNPGQTRNGVPVPNPVDNKGNPVPACDLLTNPETIKQATMYVSVADNQAEVGLRSLSPDDAQGACEIYPIKNNFVCLPPSSTETGGGCSYPATPGPVSIAFVLALLGLAVAIRRRR